MSLALTPAIHISSRAGATPCRARDLWLLFPVGDTQPHPLRALPRLEGARPLQFSLRMTNPQLRAAAAASFLLTLVWKRHRTPLLCVALWVLVQHAPPNPLAAGEWDKSIPPKPLPARFSPGKNHIHPAPSPPGGSARGPPCPVAPSGGSARPSRPSPRLPRRGARPSLGDVVPTPGLAGGRRGSCGGLRFPGPPAARPGRGKGRAVNQRASAGAAGRGSPRPPRVPLIISASEP